MKNSMLVIVYKKKNVSLQLEIMNQILITNLKHNYL